VSEFYDLDVAPALIAEANEPQPALFYGSADEFVRKLLRYQYRRQVGRSGRAEFRWRAAWWKSEEAIARIEALWRAWEAARQDPAAGMSDWWLNHCDRQMMMLMSPVGPFALSEDTNRPGEPLPYDPPPTGFFSMDLQQ
jgi:hypothetical protein